MQFFITINPLLCLNELKVIKNNCSCCHNYWFWLVLLSSLSHSSQSQVLMSSMFLSGNWSKSDSGTSLNFLWLGKYIYPILWQARSFCSFYRWTHFFFMKKLFHSQVEPLQKSSKFTEAESKNEQPCCFQNMSNSIPEHGSSCWWCINRWVIIKVQINSLMLY